MTLNLTKTQVFSFIFVAAVTLFFLAHNIMAVSNNCYNAQDLGINFQAIYHAAMGEFNPRITIHDLTLFQDHFVPALFLAVPLTWIFKSVYVAIFTEWFFVVLFFAFVFYVQFSQWKKGEITKTLFFLSLVVLFFNKGLPVALNYPLHPDTWSAPFWAGLIYSIFKHQKKAILFFAFSLFFFKETFACAIIGLSFYYFLRKDWKMFLTLFLPSLFMLYFNFKLRPQLFGNLYPYSSDVMINLDKNILSQLYGRWARIQKDIPFKLYYPFILPMFMMLKKKSCRWNLLAGLSLFSPLFAILFLYGFFYQHHAAPLTAILVSTLIFGGGLEAITKFDQSKMYGTKKRPVLSALVIITFLLSSSSAYTKYANFLFLNKNSRCLVKDRSSNNKELFSFLSKMGSEESIIATGGILPRIIPILPYGALLHQVHGFNKARDLYNYILLEKNGTGDVSPMEKDDVEKMIQRCASSAKNILIDNEFYYLAQGHFARNCTEWWK